ncbi:LapA family protein [Caryophanon tenue]|uniref:Lipopolysaccharide assembly protein A domain-containing protein n=1 Tax=Caryophanon tenue TaxID=33978 RepID=A0A1C0YMS4_9BACL|nr:lipopolysaccharide assembly protein LapA domain-containing protein [Caryophanon tenue]OCS88464.1 hypothetical protein A6M13_01050 [Caryophanon tenue]
MKIQWALILGLIFAIIIALFAMVNIEDVPVNYMFGEAYWPLILVILGSALIGAIISASFSLVRIFSLQREAKQLRKQLDQKEPELQQELRELRELLALKDAELTRRNDEFYTLEQRVMNKDPMLLDKSER